MKKLETFSSAKFQLSGNDLNNISGGQKPPSDEARAYITREPTVYGPSEPTPASSGWYPFTIEVDN